MLSIINSNLKWPRKIFFVYFLLISEFWNYIFLDVRIKMLILNTYLWSPCGVHDHQWHAQLGLYIIGWFVANCCYAVFLDIQQSFLHKWFHFDLNLEFNRDSAHQWIYTLIFIACAVEENSFVFYCLAYVGN